MKYPVHTQESTPEAGFDATPRIARGIVRHRGSLDPWCRH
jgi:hypothetical protein